MRILNRFMAVAVGGLVAQQALAGTVTSAFSAGLDGWTSNTPSQVTWQSAGGNPGGFAQFVDATGDSTNVYAPAQFLGDYLTRHVSAVSFDHDIIAETRVTAVSQYELDLSGPGGSASWFGTTPSLSPLPGGWVNVAVPISAGVPPSGWTVTSGTWAGLLANVTQLTIPIELVTNDQTAPWSDTEGLDNVILTTAVPEPATWSLMLIGIMGAGGVLRARRAKAPTAA